MPSLAENVIYWKIDGVEVQADFTDVNLVENAASSDTTHGSGTDWEEKSPGLLNCKLSGTLMYNTSNIQAQIQHLAAAQVVSMEIGMEGNTSGKPRHVQDFHIDSVDPGTVTVKKDPVMIKITASSSGAPSVNMFAGGVYS